jgi:hypothetical protein
MQKLIILKNLLNRVYLFLFHYLNDLTCLREKDEGHPISMMLTGRPFRLKGDAWKDYQPLRFKVAVT